jgi:outer membrane protein
MKKLSMILFLLAASISGNAQRFCYVDIDYILSKVPAYADAQKQLDEVSKGWQQEVEVKMKQIDEMYKGFQAEQVLMTDQMKQQKIKDIEAREKDLKEFQRSKFGPGGELFKKRQELVKPIQEKIYNKIQDYAKEKAYDFIFDKSSGVSMLYAGERFNKSEDILTALGIAPGTVGGGSGSSQQKAPSSQTNTPSVNPVVPAPSNSMSPAKPK